MFSALLNSQNKVSISAVAFEKRDSINILLNFVLT